MRPPSHRLRLRLQDLATDLLAGSFIACFLHAPALAAHASISPAPPHLERNAANSELKKAKRLVKQMVRVPAAGQRSEILDELIAKASAQPEIGVVIQDGLQEIWSLAHKKADRGVFLRSFEDLVVARQELDALRSTALNLIRDERLYPYPCTGPRASLDAIQQHKRMQAEIEDAVAAVQARLDSSPTVKLPKSMAQHLALMRWTSQARRRVCAELTASFQLEDRGTPPWLQGLPFDKAAITEGITLWEFGRSRSDGQALARDRAVISLNAERTKVALEKAHVQGAKLRLGEELEQVRLTNQYRRLLGLRVLAWDPRLHEACRIHADFLRSSNDVTHEQPDPTFRKPSDRAENCGYGDRVYENVHVGAEDAPGAFHAWFISSGHHRALVLGQVTEMATAHTGPAWTQLFGTGSDAAAQLDLGVWVD